MKEVVRHCKARFGEVYAFLELLEIMEQPSCRLAGSEYEDGQLVKPEWINISRAATYLLIYNSVESTVRTAFAELYQRMHAEKSSFSLWRSEIKDWWVRQEYRRIDHYSGSAKTYAELSLKLIDKAVVNVTAELDAHAMPISGNLDAKTVRKILISHGISDKTVRWANGGANLGVVKTKRNYLAHGNLSFDECGREVTGAELRKIARESQVFLMSIIRNMNTYSRAKGYHSVVTQ